MWQKPLAATAHHLFLLHPYEQGGNGHNSKEYVISPQSQVRLLSSDVIKTHHSLDGV